MQLKEIW